MGLPPEDVERLDQLLVHSRRTIRRAESLFRMGDPFGAIFAIRTGFIASNVIRDDGRQDVTGFHMPGEIIGMDAIGTEQYSCNAVALEHSEVCIIPFSRFEEVSKEVGSLDHQLHRVMSREIARDRVLSMLLRGRGAEERLAAFLLNLSQRFAARGYPLHELYLPLTRKEIGSLLGLALETVSRLFSKFQEIKLVSTQQRNIRILDMEGLMRISGRDKRCETAAATGRHIKSS